MKMAHRRDKNVAGNEGNSDQIIRRLTPAEPSNPCSSAEHFLPRKLGHLFDCLIELGSVSPYSQESGVQSNREKEKKEIIEKRQRMRAQNVS